jgi:hypothetical protein
MKKFSKILKLLKHIKMHIIYLNVHKIKKIYQFLLL